MVGHGKLLGMLWAVFIFLFATTSFAQDLEGRDAASLCNEPFDPEAILARTIEPRLAKIIRTEHLARLLVEIGGFTERHEAYASGAAREIFFDLNRDEIRLIVTSLLSMEQRQAKDVVWSAITAYATGKADNGHALSKFFQ